ncbi:MAG: ABC transporter permease [Candidatus Woesearchaeota archaeon]
MPSFVPKVFVYERLEVLLAKETTMALKTLIGKDLKVNFRKVLTILLIFLLPIIIIVLAANLFSNFSSAQVSLGACIANTTKANFSVFLLSQFKNISEGKIYEKDCATLHWEFLAGKIPGYLEFPQIERIEQLKYQPRLKIYLDNTNPTSTHIQTAFIQTMVRYHAVEYAFSFLKTAWSNLDQIARGLDQINNQTSTYHGIALNTTELTFDKTLITGQKKSINATKAEIKQAKQKLNQYHSQAGQQIGTIASTQQKIAQNQEKLEDIKSHLLKALELLDEASALADCGVSPQVCSKLTTARQQLLAYKASVEQTQRDLDQVNVQLEQAKEQLSQIQTDLVKTGEKLDTMDAGLDNAQQFLGVLHQKTGVIETMLEKVDAFNNATTQFVDTLSSSNQQIITALKAIASTDAKIILQPIVPEFVYAKKNLSQFEAYLPGIIVLLVYFLTLLLGSINIINEVKNGTLLNALLMQINISAIILSKIIAISVIVLVQIIAVLFISKIFFKVQLGGMQFFFLLLITLFLIIIFTGISMLIAAVSKDEYTVILLSLIFIIPFVFMQGLFIPDLVMNQTILSFVQHSPSYLAHKLMVQVYFFNAPFSAVWPYMQELLVIAVFCIGIGSWIIMRKLKTSEV